MNDLRNYVMINLQEIMGPSRPLVGNDIYFSCSALIYMKVFIKNCMTNIPFIPRFKINFISLSKNRFLSMCL